MYILKFQNKKLNPGIHKLLNFLIIHLANGPATHTYKIK